MTKEEDASGPNELGRIELVVTDEGVLADTNFSRPEMMFWLEAAKTQFFLQMFERVPEQGS